MVSEVRVRKNTKQILPYAEKVTVQKLVIEFWTVTSNHAVNIYWTSVDLLFLMKNIMWDGESGEFRSMRLVQKKKRPDKFPFIATNN